MSVSKSALPTQDALFMAVCLWQKNFKAVRFISGRMSMKSSELFSLPQLFLNAFLAAGLRPAVTVVFGWSLVEMITTSRQTG